jgi:ATP/maltotriose-dependent transcriptional regulator MalT
MWAARAPQGASAEIAEGTRSANTVKTHANAVYRKFGVACRSDARACVSGLLD